MDGGGNHDGPPFLTACLAAIPGVARIERIHAHAVGSELLRAGENDVLVIADASGRERLLPMLESVVKAVDLEGGRIVAVPQEEAG